MEQHRCPKCKIVTPSTNITYECKNGRCYSLSHCGTCGTRRARFMKKDEAIGKGLITDLIKQFAPQTAPTIDKVQGVVGSIPLVGGLLGKII